MEPGRVLRLRNIRCYTDDGRSYFEYVPDKERTRDLKRVFVCMLMGTEQFSMTDPPKQHLDTTKVLNKLVFWGEDQLKAALPEKTFEHVMKKLGEAK